MTKEPMTPQAQIEYLATKVMGWHKCSTMGAFEQWEDDLNYDHGVTKGHGRWNPLTDWNHWRQVEEKVKGERTLWRSFCRHLFGDFEHSAYGAAFLLADSDLPTRVSSLIAAHQELYSETK